MSKLYRPPCWLVTALPSFPPGKAMAEAAYALAPHVTPREHVGPNAATVLQFAKHYAGGMRGRVVFFSDLTRWLTMTNSSWDAEGTDWEAAVDELINAPVPGLYMTISQRAYYILCDSSVNGMTLYHQDGTSEQIEPEERDAVHDAIEQQLANDWPSYIRELVKSGRIS
jgi:hypothetical protein